MSRPFVCLIAGFLLFGCGGSGTSPVQSAPSEFGLDQPLLIDEQKLQAAFPKPQTLPVPAVPVLFLAGNDALATVQGALDRSPDEIEKTKYYDLSRDGVIPDDFVAYLKKHMGESIAAFDALSTGIRISKAAVDDRRFTVVISTRKEEFAGSGIAGTSPGFVRPCGNLDKDPDTEIEAKACVPKLWFYYDQNQWNGVRHALVTPGAIRHEVFHVGHNYLLHDLGLFGPWFFTAGFLWQAESFAQFGARLAPDPNAYEHGNDDCLHRITEEAFEDWGVLSTAPAHGRAYEAASLVDGIIHHAGKNPQWIFDWLHRVDRNENVSITLIKVLTDWKEGNPLDVNPFQWAYLLAMTDLYFPFSNRRIVCAAEEACLPEAQRVVGGDNLPLSVSILHPPPISTSPMRVQVAGVPDKKIVSALEFTLELQGPGNKDGINALLFAVKARPLGADQDNFYACLGMLTKLTDQGPVLEGHPKDCYDRFVRFLGFLSTSGDLKAYAPLREDWFLTDRPSDVDFVALVFNQITEDVDTSLDHHGGQVVLSVNTVTDQKEPEECECPDGVYFQATLVNATSEDIQFSGTGGFDSYDDTGLPLGPGQEYFMGQSADDTMCPGDSYYLEVGLWDWDNQTVDPTYPVTCTFTETCPDNARIVVDEFANGFDLKCLGW